MRKEISFFISFLFLISLAFAADIPNYQDRYVNDFAGILDLGQQSYLRTIFSLVEENSTAQIVFVSIMECSPLTPNEYATQLGEKWGVGQKDVDNGLVLLYCSAEKKFYIATGYGLEGILPDSKLGRFLDQYYVPQRDSGNISEGIVSFSEVIANELVLNSEEIKSANSNQQSLISLILPAIIFICVVGLVVYFFSKRQRKKGVFDFLDFLLIDFIIRTIILSILFRGGNSRSSGGGFSGGGFGGGGFGGGGAGR